MKKHVAFLVLAIFNTRPATADVRDLADVSANEMVTLFRSGNVNARWYLKGMRNGFMWANAELQAKGKTPLFCAPDTIVLTIEQELDILARLIKDKQRLRDYPVGPMLLQALTTTFPCKPEQ